MKTLEVLYLEYAEECKASGDSFGYSYWKQRAFEASSLGE